MAPRQRTFPPGPDATIQAGPQIRVLPEKSRYVNQRPFTSSSFRKSLSNGRTNVRTQDRVCCPGRYRIRRAATTPGRTALWKGQGRRYVAEKGQAGNPQFLEFLPVEPSDLLASHWLLSACVQVPLTQGPRSAPEARQALRSAGAEIDQEKEFSEAPSGDGEKHRASVPVKNQH